jgi:Na+/H+ antiporter NhaD/arsenite permease-like protein
MQNFGWKAAIAVAINAVTFCIIFRKQLLKFPATNQNKHKTQATPAWLIILHLIFLIAIVTVAHHIIAIIGLFLMFLGVTEITREYQDDLKIRESLLVGFFLAGLVVLGKGQEWWLRPLLEGAGLQQLFWGASALTAVTDNAALTYLAAQVPDLSVAAKYAVVAGAVTGGGLTVIANAPNPAGYSILKGSFGSSGIKPLGLLLAAIPPTIVAALLLMP